jgi:hypothetical protein
MLKVTKKDNMIRAETGSAIFEWAIDRGAQLVRCDLKTSQGGVHGILSGREPAPNLTLEINGRTISLADVPVKTQFEREDEDCFIFRTSARVADIFTVEQRYEVFPESVVFCEFGMFLDEKKHVNVRNAELSFPLDVLSAGKMRMGYLMRDLFMKQDVTAVHPFPIVKVSLPRTETINVNQLLPWWGLDLGWEESRYYSNRVEVVLEDWTSIGGAMAGPTRTLVGEENGRKILRWKICENLDETLKSPFFYRNKWGLFCGVGRCEAGPRAELTRRNNVMGSRVCHVMYPYVRKGLGWPWTSIPLKQVWYQDAQVAAENPSLRRIDEAVRLGCNVLILHQFWMNNGGSNSEPPADYKVFDPKWMKAVVRRAHANGMRVGLYMRGSEQYSMYSDFFEKYLKKDWDGLYVDWASPFCTGFIKASPRHFSVHNWFTFSRALRKRVGAGGFLIGHGAFQTHVSYACFDATLTGEFSVYHSGLLAEPEISASYSGFGCTGVHLMAGNAPDRIVFSIQQTAALSAGLGYSNHPFMEPNKDFQACAAYILPLWNLFRAMGADPVRSFNPAIGTGQGIRWSDEALHPIVYRAANGAALAIVSNLSDRTVTGTVDLDLAALGIGGTAQAKPLEVKGTHPLAIEGGTIRVREIPPYFFGGVLIAPAKKARRKT